MRSNGGQGRICTDSLLTVGFHVVSWTPQFAAVSNTSHWLDQARTAGSEKPKNPSGIIPVPSEDTL